MLECGLMQAIASSADEFDRPSANNESQHSSQTNSLR
jgi:hypothetical protein